MAVASTYPWPRERRAPRVLGSERRSTPLGRWVRTTRERLGISQSQLAMEAGVSQRAISFIESGERGGEHGGSARTLLRFALSLRRRDPAIDVSLESLLGLLDANEGGR